jgi:transposase
MAPKKPNRKQPRTWEAKRAQAEALFAAGQRQSTVARTLRLSRQCVHNWYWQWQGGDPSALRGRHTGSGRKSKLTSEQFAAVDEELRRGPQASGFPGKRWTLRRVAEVVERLTGIRYHASSVWRILRSLGWTLRLPASHDGRPRGYVAREWTAPSKPFQEG